MNKPVLFLGPTLPQADAMAILDADYLPPVRQGDVYRLVRDRGRTRLPSAIGIIDGGFDQVPSVWHKEILWALDQGVPVLGAASMGALRAAELHGFGMIGVGGVFEAFRDGALEADDEVAVIHAPAELDFMPLSEALVDIRATIDAAVAAGIIVDATGRALLDRARALFHADRGWPALLEDCASPLDPSAGTALRGWLPGNRVQAKRRDAVALLERLRDDPPPVPFRPSFRFERTLVWERFRAAADATPAQPPRDDPSADALTALRLDPDAWFALSARAAQRLCALEEAARCCPSPGTAVLRERLDDLRRRVGLSRRRDLTAWVQANGLDSASLGRLLKDEAALLALEGAMAGRLTEAMADLLRLDGRFAALAERGRSLREAARPGRDPSDLERARLAGWYFEEHLEVPVPTDLDAFILRLGHADQSAFFDAVERLFRHGGRRGNDADG
ncbi:hypothetical protein N825_16560 [Skermanella stibiiresistens SB22]|uniref:TfuA-like core domain-containing protein n=1 Tax=Skermanella stibiiresistens SB22 TaxID=1385369 RepID=W9H1P5_9PROT|nr:TfuA-like protein [Skermanella stibiiresistens]EWY37663.1 hypothetical protein N825_16560 [Skermanella stibiiresistens SB22]